MFGGGQNLYRRLLNDSADNLLKPTAFAIGGAGTTKISQMPFQPKQPQTGQKNKSRQLVSANIRMKNRPVSHAYGGIGGVTKAYSSSSRAVSSQGHRVLQQRVQEQN